MVFLLNTLERQLLRDRDVHSPQTLKAESGLLTTITTIGGTATLAWSFDQVTFTDFGRYFYLQAPSQRQPTSLDFLLAIRRMINQHLIAKNLHATATSTLLSAENGYINTHHNPGDGHPFINTHDNATSVQTKLKYFIVRRSLPSPATSTIKRGCRTRTRCLAKGGSDVTRLIGRLPSPGQWANRVPGHGTVAPPPPTRSFLPPEEGIRK
jgi:hypothetical protein